MMKKTLLFIAFILLGLNNAMAYDNTDFDSYLLYALRVYNANRNLSTEALLELNDALGMAESPSDLPVLKQTVEKFFSCATSDMPIYVESGNDYTSISQYQEAGWEFGATGSNQGTNVWYTQNASSQGRYMGVSGYELAKWGTGASNYAKTTVHDLPAGSYTFSYYAAGEGGVAYVYYKINDTEPVTMEIAGADQHIKIPFYANEPIACIEMGVTDIEGKSGWISVGGFDLLYSGTDALASYKAQLVTALGTANEKLEDFEGLVPQTILNALKSSIDNTSETYSTQAEYEAAVTALNVAVSNAEQAMGIYNDFTEEYNKIIDFLENEYDNENKKVLSETLSKLDDTVQTSTTYDEILAAYNALGKAYRTYLYSQANEENPVELYNSGDINSLTGWITNGTQARANGNSDWYAENGLLVLWGVKHENWAYRTLTDVPNGLYQLTAHIANSDSIKLVFGDKEYKIAGNANGDDYSQSFYLAEAAEYIQFGVYTFNGNWVSFHDLVLVYKGQNALAAMRIEYSNRLDDALALMDEFYGLIPEKTMDIFSDYLYEEKGKVEDGKYETIESLEDAMDELTQHISNVTAVKKAYEIYADFVEKIRELADTTNDKDFNEAISNAAADIEECTTVETIQTIVSTLNAAYMTCGIKYATQETPFLVFETGDITNLNDWVTGGTYTRNNGNNLWYLTSRSTPPVGAVLEMWGTAQSNYAYVKVPSLPAGVYKIAVLGLASEHIGIHFNGISTAMDYTLTESETSDEGEDMETASSVFALTAAQDTILVGIDAPATWVSVRNIKIYYLGNKGVFDIAKEQLNTIIENAQTIIDAAEGVGDNLFMIKPSALTAYSNIVATIKAAVEDYTTIDEIAEALTTLSDAKKAYETDMNLPALDTYYTIKQQASGFYLALDAEANSVKIIEEPFVFQFVAVEGGYEICANNYMWLGYEDSNSWTMSAAAATKGTWNVSLNGETYEIKGKNGYIASDDVEPRASVYGNKASGLAYGQWLISPATDDEIATNISAVNTRHESQDNFSYNLAGQKVGKDYKGIVIRGGRKYIQK